MRLKKLMKNGFFSLLSQMVLLFFGFFSQRAMTLYMGKELVGMNGVVSNVIAILSVSELGISTAIIYHLYSVLAVKDKKGISALMNLYRRAYQIFALMISVLGLLLLPFIHLFMKDNSYSVSYVRVLYLLWLFRTMISYPLSYKKSLLIACLASSASPSIYSSSQASAASSSGQRNASGRIIGILSTTHACAVSQRYGRSRSRSLCQKRISSTNSGAL